MSTDPSALLQLLSGMSDQNASDLFLCEGKAPAVRVHGAVRSLELPPTTGEALAALCQLAMAPSQREEFALHGDMDVGLSLPDGHRYRLNISRQRGVTAVVARAVPMGDLDLADLGLDDAVCALADHSRGLVLVTGATGSGKSTTLAAMINRINRAHPVHIVTVEDPIEYVHHDAVARVSQREVGGDTASFNTALRHVVRQSPDVILVGEMRDAETMTVAISAALTGHLVFASLHTVDATQTLQRILAYFPEHLRSQVAMDLSLCLRGVVSQRLLPSKDGGRALATELMTASPAVARLLREQRIDELQDLMRSLRTPGLRTFNQSLLGLLADDRIEYEVGLAYASNPDEFSLGAKGMSTGVASFDTGGPDVVDHRVDMRALLRVAMARGASDLHLAVGRPPILRISGGLVPISDRALTDGDLRMLLYSIMSGRQRSAFELDRESDFALALEDGRRFRVNAYFQKGGMAAALRAIPSTIPDADTLGLPPTLIELGTRPQGLLLVVGPTGAGKSTTLACLVDRINRTRSCRIITIEDPVEYSHVGRMATIDQREVYADTRGFGAALKYILRQDPDVILVGEMRDLETISAVITAAETGHLVLATLHSNDAVQAIDRVVDVFPGHQQGQARAQLSSCLLGVISQRLLPERDGPGRVGAFEVMVGTPAVRALIRDNKMHQARGIMEASRRDGMVTMDRALQDLYEAGRVSYEDAVRFVENPKALVPPRTETQVEAPAAAPVADAPVKDATVRDAADGKKGARRFPWSR